MPNHMIDIFHYSAGVSVYDHDFAYERISKVTENVGYAAIAPYSSAMAMGSMQVFGELGIEINMVGGSNTAIGLSDSE
ncbi:MAG: hypothetical protein V2I33_20800, partial [Kangiellaceae bacterium]|nr:hypothetical protein [Kangiellaceae bacterium]